MGEPNEFDTLDDSPNIEGQSSEEREAPTGNEEFDWQNASKEGKAPQRIDLDGKEVTIEQAKIILPKEEDEWLPTRAGNKHYKYCQFKLYYSFEGQQEFFSGVRIFKDETKKTGRSEPSIMRDGKNQASALLCKYAELKGKTPAEVSMFEYMSFLNSKPKAVLKSVEFENPQSGKKISKNMVDKFI